MDKLWLALFGSVRIWKVHCDSCDTTSMLPDHCEGDEILKPCCDAIANFDEIGRMEVVCPATKKSKRRPGKNEQKKMLLGQDNKCFWCGIPFNAPYLRTYRGRDIGPRFTKVHWDHILPFSYTGTNDDFVASCDLCNQIKGARVFDTIEEIREHVNDRRIAKGYIFSDEDEGLSRVWQEVQRRQIRRACE